MAAEVSCPWGRLSAPVGSEGSSSAPGFQLLQGIQMLVRCLVRALARLLGCSAGLIFLGFFLESNPFPFKDCLRVAKKMDIIHSHPSVN